MSAGPDLTEGEAAARRGSPLAAGIAVLHQAMERYEQAAARQAGLGRSDWRCLQELAQAGPQSPRALQRALGLTSGSVTALLDRLERRGLIRRCADPTDRRALRIKLCEPGADLLEQANAALAGLAARLAGRWGEARAIAAAQACHDLARLADWATRKAQA